jgi:hypothetical protein
MNNNAGESCRQPALRVPPPLRPRRDVPPVSPKQRLALQLDLPLSCAEVPVVLVTAAGAAVAAAAIAVVAAAAAVVAAAT